MHTTVTSCSGGVYSRMVSGVIAHRILQGALWTAHAATLESCILSSQLARHAVTKPMRFHDRQAFWKGNTSCCTVVHRYHMSTQSSLTPLVQIRLHDSALNHIKQKAFWLSGLGGSAAISLTYPFYDNERIVLLTLVALLGLCNSIAFSTAYQVVTHFQTESSVALTTGRTKRVIHHLCSQICLADFPRFQ